QQLIGVLGAERLPLFLFAFHFDKRLQPFQIGHHLAPGRIPLLALLPQCLRHDAIQSGGHTGLRFRDRPAFLLPPLLPPPSFPPLHTPTLSSSLSRAQESGAANFMERTSPSKKTLVRAPRSSPPTYPGAISFNFPGRPPNLL